MKLLHEKSQTRNIIFIYAVATTQFQVNSQKLILITQYTTSVQIRKEISTKLHLGTKITPTSVD